MSFDQDTINYINMWASIPILSPWFRMVWDAASTYNLYLATPLGHIARNLLFHTNYFERLCWFLSVFHCISIFSGTGVCLKIRRPPQPNASNVWAYFWGNSRVPTSPCIWPSLSISLSMIELCPRKYVLTDILTQGLSPEVFLSKQSSIIQSPFFLLFIDPFIKPNPPIPSLSIEANQVNSPSSIRLLTCIIHWIALICFDPFNLHNINLYYF